MKKDINDIRDDEFRVIGLVPSSAGKTAASQNGRGRNRKYILAAVLLLILAGIFAAVRFASQQDLLPDETSLAVFEPQEPEATAVQDTLPAYLPHILGKGAAAADGSYMEQADTVINDIPLMILIPHGVEPELKIGVPDKRDTSIVFCAQAADIRRDNGKIVGAFVLKGEPKAWGLSKKGYCAIIGKKMTVGVADNSPLFEEATEKGGDFFRQYPLVDKGVLVENNPKNKSERRAICSRNGQIFIALCNTEESFHDFAQALVDLGVDHAVSLIGSNYANVWFRNPQGELQDLCKAYRGRYRYENYIVFRKPQAL